MLTSVAKGFRTWTALRSGESGESEGKPGATAMWEWVVHKVAAGTIACVFALALYHKGRDFPRFRASFEAYGIVPSFLVPVCAPLLMGLEAGALVCLFLPDGPGSLLSFSVLGIYSVAIAVNLIRGRDYIDCGCGDLPTPLSGWLILRNGLLMALAWPYGAAPEVAAVEPVTWLLVVMTVVVLMSLYLILEQLLANAGVGVANRG
jgi:hypothetical protein